MPASTRVKICCMGSVEELHLAVRLGATAVGLVSAMPSGAGVISDAKIREISGAVPAGIDAFLLTSGLNPYAVIEQIRSAGVTTVQLVDAFPVAGYAMLRKALPGIRIVQVIHVRDDRSVAEAAAAAEHADFLLLDSGNPDLPVKELGGTGRVHDWRISRMICERVRTPAYLAGGLRPDNVAEAIRTVRPFGVDVCSGVRSNGALDESKLRSFFEAVQSC